MFALLLLLGFQFMNTVLKHKLRRDGRIYTLEEHITLTDKTWSTSKFSVEKVETEQIIDIKMVGLFP
jgi:hypothetical protein